MPEIALGHLRQMVYASLLAALTAAGGYIQLPIGPVPIVLQNLFVLVAGLILGPRWGLTSMGIYLLLGLVGFPVFAGGKGGLAHLMGPTGGYLLGFLAGCLDQRLDRRPFPRPFVPGWCGGGPGISGDLCSGCPLVEMGYRPDLGEGDMGRHAAVPRR